MRLTLFIPMICVLGLKSNAQIYFNNPSFEEDTFAPCGGCMPSSWYTCYYQVSLADTSWTSWNPTVLNSYVAPDGQFLTSTRAMNVLVFGIESQGTIAQKLVCSLKPARHYTFSLKYLSMMTNSPGGPDANFFGHSHLQVIGTNDSCQIGEILFEQYDTDTAWHTMMVSFTPTQEWNTLWFKQKPPLNDNYDGWMDALSPIQCFNYKEVQSLTNDTAIWINDCVMLNAIPSGGYDSAYWKTVDGNFISNALVDVIVCPDVYTEYVVCTRSTDCGNFWSYDTVRVDVFNSVAATKALEFSLAPTLNCTNGEFTFTANAPCELSVFDATGRRVLDLSYTNGVQRFALNSELSAGYYFCKIKSEKAVRTERIALAKCD